MMGKTKDDVIGLLYLIKRRMKRVVFKNLSDSIKSENGRTLIEIVVSIAVLAIIIVPFTSLFIQSSKSLNVSDEIMDATYVAQTVMEEVYHLSQTTSFPPDNYPPDIDVVPDGDDYVTKMNLEGFHVVLALSKDNSSSELVNVLTQVYDNSSNMKLESQMETYLLWGDDE